MNQLRKKKKYSNRVTPFFLAAMLGVTALPALPVYAVENQEIRQAQAASENMSQEAIAANAEKYGLTEEVEDGAILHCWCWSFNTIKENMADIAAAGFSTIQTSPANECNDTHPNMKIMGSDTSGGTDGCWWWHYQPTDWKIGNYQLGTKAEFEAMCNEADKYGVKVIVDVIPNHVTPELEEVSQDLYNAAGGKDNLFHENGFREIQNGGDWSWGNRLACTTGQMGGLPDVNTENEGFQKYFMTYLNDLIECGADGFRYDTAKHIGVPSDPKDPRSPENDFWPVATGEESVGGVTLKDADRIFTYGEVLQGDNVPEKEYAKYMRMTASSYGGKLRGAVQGKNFSVNNIMNWQHSAPESLVTWVESHDTYCNAGESVGLSDSQIRLAWAVIAARADGTPLFYSRPDGSNGWSNRWGNNVLGKKGNDQFKHPEVVAVNKFRNEMEGQNEYLRNINGSSQILQIDRGTKGTCIINLGGEQDINTETKMENGTYKDHVSGRTFTVSNGKISGHLSKEAVAVIYKESGVVQSGSVGAEAKDGKTTFTTDTTTVTLRAENVTNAEYSTTEGAKGSYEDGDEITVGKTLKAGDSVTITVTAESKTGKVTAKLTLTKTEVSVEEVGTAYLNLPSGWNEPYVYVYSESTEESNAAWPGVKMEKAEADETNGYTNLYKYTVPDHIKDPLVIFYGGDHSKRYPGDMQPGLKLTGTMIYENGQWHEYQVPEPIDWTTLVTGDYDVYIKKPADWGKEISCYAYENEWSNNAGWPGVKMEYLGEGVYAYNLPETWTNANVMFTDGNAQIPGAMEPGYVYEADTSMLCYNGEWTIVEKEEEKEPVITVSAEDGTVFDSESMEVTIDLENASAGTYSLDGGPAQEFGRTTTVCVGKGKIADTDVTLQVTAKGEKKTAEQTFTFHKQFNAEKNGGVVEYEVTKETKPEKKAAASAADAAVSAGEAVGGKYATNPDGQAGKNATIASAADFTEDMIIAQGVANDDPRIFRGSHEGPVYDTYALYGAWDDSNIYLGWQFTNVTDVVDPAQGYPISDNGKPYNGDIPQMIALNVGSGNAGNGALDTGGFVWGIDVGYETPIDTLICFSSKPGVGVPALFRASEDGTFSYDTCVGLEEAGISYIYEDGFFGSSLNGVKANGYDGYNPSMLLDESSNWVDFLNEGHSASQDTFYTMTIPMESLGITKEQLETDGIGVMHISTFGASGIGSIPMDMTMLDNATGEYSQDASTSAEKEDTDVITVPLAGLGNATVSGGGSGEGEGGGNVETEKRTMTVNFGADRSAPQTDETDLTLQAQTTGGEGNLTYTFMVDGKEVENAGADSALWDTTGGTHRISVTVTDEQGHKVTVEKEYDITGEVVPEKELKIISLTASEKSPQKPLTKVKFTAEAEGGSGKLQYRFVRIASDGTEKVLKDYRDQNYASCNPKKGTYKIRVEVKDEAGNTAQKTMKFTWK